MSATAQGHRAVLITSVWPEPTSSAAGVRDEGLLSAFLREGWSVSCFSPARENDFSGRLRDRGIPARSIEANDPRFDEAIAELRPAFVVFDRFVTEEQFGWRVEKNAPHAVRVLDTQDVHFLRQGRRAALEAGVALERIWAADLEFRSDPVLRELASIHRSDLTLVLSDFEMELLDRLGVPASTLLHLPIGYPPGRRTPGWESRRGFAMIGNFRHAPNTDAVRWLRSEIWPLVRARLPGARVDVYGAYPPREMTALTDAAQGFHVVGPAPDAVAALSRHRVNLAPLRFGAGIKGKIADGWLAGSPCVTTPVGAEGMGWGLAEADRPWGGIVARGPEELAEAALQLHESPMRWAEAAERGRAILAERFDEGALSRRLLERLYALRTGLTEARAANLTGAMLRMNQHRSTEYFSRWIEAKNGIPGNRPPAPR